MTPTEADQAVSDVLEAHSAAYAVDAGLAAGIVVDYVVIYAVRRYDDDGQPTTAYGTVLPADARTSHYAALGLLDYGTGKIRRDLFDD